MKKSNSKGLIYSTDTGRTCPDCGLPVKKCRCSKGKNPLPGDGIVRISRQTKGRKGGGVCLISGIPLSEAELKKLAKQLKKKCGSGGTVKNGVIEIQGDQRQVLAEALTELGFRAKLAGG